MTAEDLYKKVIDQLEIREVHPLHKALLEECCENAINNPQKVTDNNTLIFAVQTAFLTCCSTLKGTLAGAVEYADADQVTLNYRNQAFIIPKNSPFIN